MKKFWLSWYHGDEQGEFELHSPWWLSGYRCSDDAATICAAVQADSAGEAVAKIYAAYDTRPSELEIRFCEEKDPDWSPFCGRFARKDWMTWPERVDKKAGKKR